MTITILRLGSPRRPNEGPRLGTVRFPPRGVRKEEIAELDLYDVWLPNLSPSRELIGEFKKAGSDEAAWRRLARGYLKEMKATEPRQLLDAMALLSHTTSFSMGCYCEDENRCHRSLLRELLEERGADLV